MSRMPHIFLDALLLAALGATLGLAVNHRLVSDAFSGKLAASPVASVPASRLPQPVLLAEVRELAKTGAVLVDARDGALYADGHLPGAISLPLGEIEAQLAGFRQRVEVGRTLVVYCNGYGCADSFDLGQYLMAHGFSDVRVFEGGLPEWRDAGLPLERGGR